MHVFAKHHLAQWVAWCERRTGASAALSGSQRARRSGPERRVVDGRARLPGRRGAVRAGLAAARRPAAAAGDAGTAAARTGDGNCSDADGDDGDVGGVEGAGQS